MVAIGRESHLNMAKFESFLSILSMLAFKMQGSDQHPCGFKTGLSSTLALGNHESQNSQEPPVSLAATFGATRLTR